MNVGFFPVSTRPEKPPNLDEGRLFMMSTSLEVFCCYAREDQEMVTRLITHLMPLRRQGYITVWNDTSLNAGVEWEKELHQHLESADIFLLLISPDFVASDYCYSIEMRRAMERHDQGSAHVIPVLLRPTLWQNAPFARLQVVPTNARPVTRWPNRDDAFHDITEHINKVITGHQTEQNVPSFEAEPLSRRTILLIGAAGTATIVAVGTGVFVISHLHSSPGSANPDRSVTPPDRTVTPSQGSPVTLLTPIAALTGHTGIVSGVSWSPDGKYIASASSDKTVRVWEWNADATPSPLIYEGHNFPVLSVAWSPNSKQLVSSGGDQVVQVCNVSANDIRGPIGIYESTDPGTIFSVAWSPDGAFIVDGGSHCNVWKASGGPSLVTYRGHSMIGIHAVAWSPDSKQIASAGTDATVRVWNASDGGNVFTYNHATKVLSVAWSPDGTRIASASADGMVQVWNARDDSRWGQTPTHTSGSFRCGLWSLVVS